MNNQFKEYTGDYDKTFYDVLDEDGIVSTQVWPNAGRFEKCGITLTCDDDPRKIFIRESPIRPVELDMDVMMTEENYLSIFKDDESIAHYSSIRKPIADAEHKLWEEEQQMQRIEDQRNSPIIYKMYAPSELPNPSYRKPIDKVKRKAQRKAKKAARQRARKGRG